MTRRLRRCIQQIMTGPARCPFLSLATLLWAGSLLYSGGLRMRNTAFARRWRPRLHLPRPVISVGNLTTGGTGKTPMTMHLAQLVAELGYRSVIVSRGYKGNYAAPALVVGDGRKVLADAGQAGDEPFLMAAQLAIPVVVGRNRHIAGRLAIARFEPDLLLLDDGFQHLELHRDLDVLLLDAARPFGNTHLLPRGTLREPADALLRADAIVLTRSTGRPAYFDSMCRRVRPRPLFLAEHAPVTRGMLPAFSCRGDYEALPDLPAVERSRPYTAAAFSGLARNDLFQRALRDQGIHLKLALEFDDHHTYGPLDVRQIDAMAAGSGAEALITSDKDFVRLPKDWRMPLPLIVMGVALKVTGGTRDWREYIAGRIAALMSERACQK